MPDFTYDDLQSAILGRPNEHMVTQGGAMGADIFPKRAIGDMSNMASQASIPPWLLPILMAVGFRGRGGHAGADPIRDRLNQSLSAMRRSTREMRDFVAASNARQAAREAAANQPARPAPPSVDELLGGLRQSMAESNYSALRPRDLPQSRPQTEVGNLVRSHFGQDNRNPATGRNEFTNPINTNMVSATIPDRRQLSVATMFPQSRIANRQLELGYVPNMRPQSFNPTYERNSRLNDAMQGRTVLTPANRTPNQSYNLALILQAIRGNKPEGQ